MMTAELELLAVGGNLDDLTALQAAVRDALPGAEVLIAPSGARCLELARARDPDVILLDIAASGMDGLAVCRELKADERLADVPVLLLIAPGADRASRASGLDAGAEGFVSKRWEELELVAQVRAMAKIKAANRFRRLETERLAALVTERTRELEQELAARIRAEAALKRLSARHEAIIEEIPDIVMEVDANKVYTWANPVGLEFFGDDVIGSEASRYFVRDQDTYEKVQPLFNGDTSTFYVESWQRRKDGRERLLAWWCRALKGSDGRVIGALSTARDITDLEQAVEALRESERRYRLVTENTSDVIWTMNLNGELTYVSPTSIRLSGYTADELMRRPLADQLSPSSTRAVADGLKQLLDGARQGTVTGPIVGEVEQRHKDGSTFWTESSIEVVRDDAKGSLMILGVTRNVSQRKKAEMELQAERDNLRVFLNAAPTAIFVLDEREEVLHANPAAERLFGQTVTGSDLRRCGDLIGCARRGEGPRGCGSGPPCPSCALYGAVREGLAGRAVRDRDVEIEVDARGGTERRQLVCNAAPIALEGRHGAVVAVHDITELRKAQQERERLRTSLAQSDRLASMGMLAAGVAHEINNPLSYVLFNLESLADDLPGLAECMGRCHAELTSRAGAEAVAALLGAGHEVFNPAAFEDALERLREAATGARRIRQIARSLGTFSRVERNEVTPVSVHACIEHALTMAFNEIRFRARVVKDFGDVPAVLATDGKLAQVFLNLFINAAHSIDEGRVERNEIRVRTWAEGERVFVEVSDTGTGIAPEHRAKVFEPFFTTKGVGVGSGLGLSICKSIITSFGGEISFESEVGRGTRFLIELPRMRGDSSERGADAPEGAPAQPRIRGRILVVDDEPGIRATLNRMLGRDHEVVLASSGEEGKALLAEDRRFDLVLCDLMMPRMSGMELHAWLASQDPWLAGQVVFITGGAFTPGAAEYLARLGNLRVEKPFDTANMRKMIGELVLAARAKRGG